MQLVHSLELPACDDGDETELLCDSFLAPIELQVEPVGQWYEALCKRRLRQTSLSTSFESEEEEEEEEDLEFDDDDEVLLASLDPKKWKDQDHYAVLGLSSLRYKATCNQVKIAYKRKVLKHHPDKRRARGLEVKQDEDDYFTCISRAYETIGNSSKKRAYDSIDPTFDNSIPSPADVGLSDFIKLFRPVFESNARWSVNKNVPMLGSLDSSFDEVNRFYTFWYEFESWREYSYLDEEDKDKGENREERRWIEKQNKAARQKLKKEEISRIRQLVDNAYNCDPRIARFKEEEKAKKMAVKKAKQEAARAKLEEEMKVKREEEEAEKKRIEEEKEKARAEAAVIKKEKDAQKRMVKKEKKTFRNFIKDNNYYTDTEDEKLELMQEIDKLEELLDLMSLRALNEELLQSDRATAKKVIKTKIDEMNAELEKEKKKNLELFHKTGASSISQSNNSQPWSEEEQQLLIKGVNLFPAGTVQRWETVANFMSQHIAKSRRTPKEVLAMAKELQKMDPTIKKQVNQKAYSSFAKDHLAVQSSSNPEEISQRFVSPGEQQVMETGSNAAPWSPEEQKLLEQALKTYPANTPERWDRISEVINTRSKKDCMRRYKELVVLIQAKKSAMAAVKK